MSDFKSNNGKRMGEVLRDARLNYVELSTNKKILIGSMIVLPIVVLVVMVISLSSWSSNVEQQVKQVNKHNVMNGKGIDIHQGSLTKQSNLIDHTGETELSKRVQYQSLMETQKMILSKLKSLSTLVSKTQGRDDQIRQLEASLNDLKKSFNEEQTKRFSSLNETVQALVVKVDAINKKLVTPTKSKSLLVSNEEQVTQLKNAKLPFNLKSIIWLNNKPYATLYSGSAMAQSMVGVGDSFKMWSIESISGKCAVFVPVASIGEDMSVQEVKECV